MSRPWGLFGLPWAVPGPCLGLLKLFLGPSWAMLVSLGDLLSSNHQFSFSFSMFLARRSWASLGVRGHPLCPLGAILGFAGRFLGPSRGHLGPLLGSLGVHGHPSCSLGAILGIPGLLLGPSRGHLHPYWPRLGSSLAIFGACLRPSWASYGAGWAALGSSLADGHGWGP